MLIGNSHWKNFYESVSNVCSLHYSFGQSFSTCIFFFLSWFLVIFYLMTNFRTILKIDQELLRDVRSCGLKKTDFKKIIKPLSSNFLKSK